MTDHTTRDETVDSGDDHVDSDGGPTGAEGVASTEAYEQGDVVVLYDAENPLAWIEADSAVRVERMA
jgi:hypothetical protein